MDQISVLIGSMCSIRDNDLRLIERKQVESYKHLPQMVLGPSGSDCGEDAPMIAADFPDQALSPWGREAQSIAFFKTPGME
jgi:hypothetical protein